MLLKRAKGLRERGKMTPLLPSGKRLKQTTLESFLAPRKINKIKRVIVDEEQESSDSTHSGEVSSDPLTPTTENSVSASPSPVEQETTSSEVPSSGELEEIWEGVVQGKKGKGGKPKGLDKIQAGTPATERVISPFRISSVN